MTAVNIFNLEHALEKVVIHPVQRRTLTAEMLCARDAGPLVEMVEMMAGHQIGEQEWKISNLGRVQKLARVSAVLDLLEKTLLPLLRQRPLANPPHLLAALGYSADHMRVLSAGVGGAFNHDAQLFCDSAHALVAEALALPPHVVHTKIRSAIDNLMDLARRLRHASYTISQVDEVEEEEAAVAAEDDEEEGGQGAAEEEGVAEE